jgi:uncharacterized protein
MLDPLVSRLFFRPTHNYLPSEKEELIVSARWGDVQIWREYHVPAGSPGTTPALLILRFLGSRGRAEIATLDPANRLADIASEVWTVNAPGFGRTTGPASLRRYADASLLALEALLKHAAGRPVWVAGKSLGTAAALHVCAQLGASGLIVRNAMPLRELITRRYAAWNLWLPAWTVAHHIPPALDNIANAARCKAPALFLVSRDDRIVPPAYQHRVIDAYKGSKTILNVAGGHDERTYSVDDESSYLNALQGFREVTIGEAKL